MRQWNVVGVDRVSDAALKVGPYDSLLVARVECARMNADDHVDAWVREVEPDKREF